MMYKEQTNEAVELLKMLIATPSVSRDEAAAAAVLEAYMREKGLNPQRHGNNVWICWKSKKHFRKLRKIHPIIERKCPKDRKGLLGVLLHAVSVTTT